MNNGKKNTVLLICLVLVLFVGVAVLVISLTGGDAPVVESSVPMESSSTAESSLPPVTSVPMQESSSAVSSKEALPRELTQAELEDVQNALTPQGGEGDWDMGDLVFTTCFYKRPEEADLNEILYTGGPIGQPVDDPEVRKTLGKAWGWGEDEFAGDLMKITKTDLTRFVKEKLGISLDAVKTKFRWTYLESSDAYYASLSDTNIIGPGRCVDGVMDEKGRYVVRVAACKDYDEETGKYTYEEPGSRLTMEKTDSGFRYISNVSIRPNAGPKG